MLGWENGGLWKGCVFTAFTYIATYLPMSLHSSGLYWWYAPRFPFSLTWISFSVAACTSWIAQVIAWGGIMDESDPFGSGSPSLCCRYRSRAISPVHSCSHNHASLFSWLKIFRLGKFRGLSQPRKYFNNENFPNYYAHTQIVLAISNSLFLLLFNFYMLSPFFPPKPRVYKPASFVTFHHWWWP